MKMQSLILVMVLLLAGCTSQTAQTQQPAANTSAQTPPSQPVQQPPAMPANNTTMENQTAPAPSPAPAPAPAPPPSGKVAHSQADCAVLTPDCGSCVAISGCGWCKTSNSCFYGDANGPKAGQCQMGDWAVNQSSCAGPTGGSNCASQTNCVSCLSGSSCKFCIQGTRCVDASSTDSCLGGWLNISYQCNYASR